MALRISLQNSLLFALPKVQFAGALKCPLRALSVSTASQLKRPVFEGPLPPKRPINAYMLYLMDKSSTVPLDNGKINLKTLGEMWRNLAATETKVYQTKAILEKVRYEKKYKDFLSGIGGKKKQETYLLALKNYKSEKREYMKKFRLQKKDLLKPRKRSGYNMFVSKLMLDAKVSSLEETQNIMKTAAVKWKALNDKAREAFGEEAQLLFEHKLKEYEKRLKKAIKAGELPMPDETAKKGTTKAKTGVATTKKKGTTKEKTAAVKKTLEALLKDVDLETLVEHLQKSKVPVEGTGITESGPAEQDASQEEASEVLDASQEEVLDALQDLESSQKEASSEVVDASPEQVSELTQQDTEGGAEGDIFADSDSESAKM